MIKIIIYTLLFIAVLVTSTAPDYGRISRQWVETAYWADR